MGSIRSKKLVEDLVNLFADSKTRTASTIQAPVQDTTDYNNLEQQQPTVQTINQAAQLPSESNAVNVTGQSDIDVVQTENLGSVAGNLNHLEILSREVQGAGSCLFYCSTVGVVSRIPPCSNAAIWQ